ncbi:MULTISPECIES: helix-turn-helix domain-containing protein [Pantoea]|uniref:winged helix-turn-helix transcriptional regulator n=1 Tax=Pantoea TaxID=53335 RepID=UPI001231F419|nr:MULTISPECIES: helix-turn-helix domain-containing protein [Pantoea]KAF6655125.1 helix-turn-helix transcriptional regulator [Enterobacteriaceae bacterium EKM102V]KAA5970271.1 helix-turn-helix transcriptional regulator [Pantoea sp. M_6]KAA5976381.1 helix-turn-helix transcriptional regulator [Pantoea sp. M_8]KAA5987666.1 helix-turn-helix transcriptional regulator [Pantoea sp. M_10]KAA5991126.1 helix-turn-helix transcriptional regulator [Pantoea sp. M_5]
MTTSNRIASCPNRIVLDQISDKWSVLVILTVSEKPIRFNEIKRRIGGITQKALTQCLRKLERNGIVERCVVATSPIAVEYRITPLGHSLDKIFHTLLEWTNENLGAVIAAQQEYDSQLPQPVS